MASFSFSLASPELELFQLVREWRTIRRKYGERKQEVIISSHLQKYGGLEAQDKDGNTPLAIACICCNVPLVHFFIERKGAHINATNNNGDTPLILACSKGLVDVARILVEKGANVNAKNNNGYTPLIWACLKGHEDVARLLIEKGADVNAKNNDGDTPLDLACNKGHEEVAQLLIEKGAEN